MLVLNRNSVQARGELTGGHPLSFRAPQPRNSHRHIAFEASLAHPCTCRRAIVCIAGCLESPPSSNDRAPPPQYPERCIHHGERVCSDHAQRPCTQLTFSSWAPFIGLVVVAIFCGAAWFLSPKGETQTQVCPHALPTCTFYSRFLPTLPTSNRSLIQATHANSTATESGAPHSSSPQ